ncbi:MAG TPA: PQQ-binding-like beta-propeller repeat protein [Kofleriaceae bacterium]|nr:PQQ-binding-like beta-propeller repeat protein [Kofleriaceae bacterium]
MRCTMKLALAALVALATACGGKAVFRLSSDENNSYALAEALAKRHLPATPQPVNGSGKPRVFALVAGAGSAKTIVAYDLDASATLWKADGDVASRIAVGGDFVCALEGKQLVARDQSSGKVRWRVEVPGTFIGAAADRERAYLVYKAGSTHWLAGYSGSSGKQLWKADAAGELGAPAAHGGVVYVPFLKQWLSIVDGNTGRLLTRIRGLDQEITTLRVTSTAAYYGSKQGIFQLDTRSASGKRTDSTYGTVKIPAQLDGTTYGREAYDPVQHEYTAFDRKRVLWTALPVEQGPMKLAGDTYAIHYFRYVLGFAAEGGLRWAYAHPRVELVASDHTGSVIATISGTGDIVALDPNTGAVRARANLGLAGAQVVGATFDADGWGPSAQTEPVDTVAALAAIVHDRDARFDRVKELAIAAMAVTDGAHGEAVTSELLGVLADHRAPLRLKDAAVAALVQRHDPASLPVLVKQLAVHDDFLAKTEAESLGPVAKAIAGLAGEKLDPKLRADALAALQLHLDAPSTDVPELVQVIAAMAAIGDGAEGPALASHLWLYHAADELGGDPTWQKAIATTLAGVGPGEREHLRQVAADPRTKPGLTATIREVLGTP